MIGNLPPVSQFALKACTRTTLLPFIPSSILLLLFPFLFHLPLQPPHSLLPLLNLTAIITTNTTRQGKLFLLLLLFRATIVLGIILHSSALSKLRLLQCVR